jgi:glycosyltransferase involved in cell wall biosynthesis
MVEPFFSVIIPAFNREKFIQKAIDSVLGQDFTNFELIIVDDASTDKTVEIVKANVDNRIKLVIQPENRERGAARNAGIRAATGKYICYLDSDDRFLTAHLSNFYKHIEKDGFPDALYFSNTMLETKDKIYKRAQPAWDEKNKFGYLLRFTFSPCRVCVSRNVALEFPFDETIPGIEDLDNWLHIATKFPILQLHEVTAVYVDHGDSYSIGDSRRFEKELQFFNKIFSKEILKDLLPKKERFYLFSKCHYHLAIQSFNQRKRIKTLIHCYKAFSFYPKGYNENANKTMFVMALYSLPFVGPLIEKFIHFVKKK